MRVGGLSTLLLRLRAVRDEAQAALVLIANSLTWILQIVVRTKGAPSRKKRGKDGATPILGIRWHPTPYFSVRFFPSIMTLRKIWFIRVW